MISIYTKSTWCNELPPEWTMSAAVLHMRYCTWEAVRLLHAICITFSNGTSSGDHRSSISMNFLFTLDGCMPFILRHPLKWTVPLSFNERRGVLRVPCRLYQMKYIKLTIIKFENTTNLTYVFYKLHKHNVFMVYLGQSLSGPPVSCSWDSGDRYFCCCCYSSRSRWCSGNQHQSSN